jgi:hypothetical protein
MNINGMNSFDIIALTSAPSASGLRCRACQGPIALRDDFGRSEGICRRCMRQRPAGARSLLERLLRAA